MKTFVVLHASSNYDIAHPPLLRRYRSHTHTGAHPPAPFRFWLLQWWLWFLSPGVPTTTRGRGGLPPTTTRGRGGLPPTPRGRGGVPPTPVEEEEERRHLHDTVQFTFCTISHTSICCTISHTSVSCTISHTYIQHHGLYYQRQHHPVS
jgi:hypothetical protein